MHSGTSMMKEASLQSLPPIFCQVYSHHVMICKTAAEYFTERRNGTCPSWRSLLPVRVKVPEQPVPSGLAAQHVTHSPSEKECGGTERIWNSIISYGRILQERGSRFWAGWRVGARPRLHPEYRCVPSRPSYSVAAPGVLRRTQSAVSVRKFLVSFCTLGTF